MFILADQPRCVVYFESTECLGCLYSSFLSEQNSRTLQNIGVQCGSDTSISASVGLQRHLGDMPISTPTRSENIFLTLLSFS